MKCSEIITLLEQEYGKEYACDWDNVGLLAGRRDKEVKKILLALDATDEVVEQAAEGAYDMLITHHPMIFGAIKRVTDEDIWKSGSEGASGGALPRCRKEYHAQCTAVWL